MACRDGRMVRRQGQRCDRTAFESICTRSNDGLQALLIVKNQDDTSGCPDHYGRRDRHASGMTEVSLADF